MQSNANSDEWPDLLALALDKDPHRAERVARLFHYLLADIESGPEGATRAIESLENAFRLAFSFTKTYRTCLILFMVSLGEDFPPDLDSMELLTEAMRRLKVELRRASRSQSKKKPRRKAAL
ncbi:MAG: hypothetical protein DMF61_04665 [Blastocatellia bacterium AA13]|nr:MAG: hypothetical protein DMF61_04665 [Blastocatellia bacterium AA13]